MFQKDRPLNSWLAECFKLWNSSERPFKLSILKSLTFFLFTFKHGQKNPHSKIDRHWRSLRLQNHLYILITWLIILIYSSIFYRLGWTEIEGVKFFEKKWDKKSSWKGGLQSKGGKIYITFTKIQGSKIQGSKVIYIYMICTIFYIRVLMRMVEVVLSTQRQETQL